MSLAPAAGGAGWQQESSVSPPVMRLLLLLLVVWASWDVSGWKRPVRLESSSQRMASVSCTPVLSLAWAPLCRADGDIGFPRAEAPIRVGLKTLTSALDFLFLAGVGGLRVLLWCLPTVRGGPRGDALCSSESSSVV